MAGAEYRDALFHNDIKRNQCKCNSMENMKTYSKEIEHGNKKVKITIVFPSKANPKETDAFEHMLKEVYLDTILKGYLQGDLHAIPLPPLKGKCEASFPGRNES